MLLARFLQPPGHGCAFPTIAFVERCTINAMEPIDVDDIVEVNYLDDPAPGEQTGVEVRFKDGTSRFYSGEELPGVLTLLNHWTPPTA